MKQTLIILTFVLSFTSVFAQNLTDSIRHEIRRRVDSKINPGIAIAILNPDESVDYYNFGISDIKSSKQVNEHTTFEIASITKTFTASILLEHQEEIYLDESILNYLPSVDNEKLGSIRISDLLNHKSGLPRLSEEFSPADWSNPFSDYSQEKLTAELHNVKVDTSKQWSYSNLGYAALGRIIENATNQDIKSLFNRGYYGLIIMGPTLRS
jgi:D-alanyl-D-alanine-carboxypeptidase/D-alanyl-D-alanine-endopeptidase